MTAAIILILLSVADIATTHRFLQLGIREANPPCRVLLWRGISI